MARVVDITMPSKGPLLNLPQTSHGPKYLAIWLVGLPGKVGVIEPFLGDLGPLP